MKEKQLATVSRSVIQNGRQVVRKVILPENKDDILCILMCEAGQSNKAIKRELGYSQQQIGKLVKRFGCYRKNYRDGLNQFSRKITSGLDAMAQKHVIDRIEKYLLK